MKQYLDLLSAALSGEERPADRTGAGTIGVYERQARFDLNEGFPLITTKSTGFKTIAKELLWFLSGSDNIRPLVVEKCPIWSLDAMRSNMDYIVKNGVFSNEEVEQARADAKKARDIARSELPLKERVAQHDALMVPAQELQKRFEQRIVDDEAFAKVAGHVGPSYGVQWRGKSPSQPIDQIAQLEESLQNYAKTGSYSRRMIVDPWNPQDVPKVALPWCHGPFQTHVSPKSNKLTLGWTQRSCDTVLGVPFNIASYALLAELLAHTHGFDKGEVVGNFRDLHVYLPHVPAAQEQLAREPKPLGKLVIKNKKASVLDYKLEDFALEGYHPHPKLENPTPMYGGLF
ncbi:MAG TPA: thymidylate synthase [Candidatus Nanoarchaeia archaeon]|nr:thymidylate synthase [Candidatus Nanoarchaeia archaeon]